jgi:hypothetical protein
VRVSQIARAIQALEAKKQSIESARLLDLSGLELAISELRKIQKPKAAKRSAKGPKPEAVA